MARAQVYRGNPEQKQTILFDNFSGGMNTTSTDDQVMTNEFRLLQNVELEKQGRIQKRKGFGKIDFLTESGKYQDITKLYHFQINNKLVEIIYLDHFNYLNYAVNDHLNDTYETIFSVRFEEYVEPKLTGIDILNFNGMKYFLLNQVVKDNDEIVMFGKHPEDGYIFKRFNKLNAFRPNPYDISVIGEGFNLFSEQPHQHVDTSSTSTKSITGIILTDTEDMSKILYKIPRTGTFKVMVYYTGDLDPELLTLKFYTIDDDGDKVDLTELEYNYNPDENAKGYFVYDVELNAISNNEVLLDVYYEIIHKTTQEDAVEVLPESIHNINDFVVHFRDIAIDDFKVFDPDAGRLRIYEKTPDTYKFNMTIKEVYRDGYNTYDDSYYKFKDKNPNRFNVPERTSIERPKEDIYYVQSGELRKRKGIVGKANRNIIETGVPEYWWANRKDLNQSLRFTMLSNSTSLTMDVLNSYGGFDYLWYKDYARYFINKDMETTFETPKCTSENVGLVYQKLIYDYDSQGNYKPMLGNSPRNYPHGVKFSGGQWDKNTYKYKLYLEPQMIECKMNYNYNRFEYNAYNVESDFENVIVTDKNDALVKMLDMNKTYKVGSDYYIWNGGTEGTVDDFNKITDDVHNRVVTHTVLIKVSDSSEPEYEEIKPFNFKDAKAEIIQQRMVMFNENTIWWSSVYSEIVDSYGNIQNFTYFPNNNWVAIPLGIDDSIQAIKYYRGSYMIFTKESIYRMRGNIGGSDFEISIVNDAIGCIAPDTIRSFNNTLQFLSHDGLYIMKQNYYMEGMENVEKIDKNISDLIGRHSNYESLMNNEQYWLIEKNEDNSVKRVFKQYYNMEAARKSHPFTVDIYGRQPDNIIKIGNEIYSFVADTEMVTKNKQLSDWRVWNSGEETYEYQNDIQMPHGLKGLIEGLTVIIDWESLDIAENLVVIDRGNIINNTDIPGYTENINTLTIIDESKIDTDGYVLVQILTSYHDINLKFYEDRLVADTTAAILYISLEEDTIISDNNFYKYDEGYSDFGYDYETIIETPNWSLGYPLHEKKFKNVFLNVDAESRMPIFIDLEFDKLKNSDVNVYEVKVNKHGELEYEITRNPKYLFETTGRLVLDEGLLSLDRLGESGFQVHKVIASNKGRYVKLRFTISKGQNFAIDSINFVYKLGKMRERR